MGGHSSLLLAFLIFLSNDCRGLSPKQSETDYLLRQLFTNYDAKLRPSGSNNTEGPVDIRVNLMLLNVHSFSEFDMQYGLTLYFRQEWMDERLKYDKPDNLHFLTLTDPAQLWTGDLFISNEKESYFHNILKPNIFLRVYPSGRVLSSQRLTLYLTCLMNLDDFPFDSQHCYMKIGSYAHTIEDINLLWREESPLQISNLIFNHNEFTLKHYDSVRCNAYSTAVPGEFSCLKLELVFQRKLTFYVINTFLQSMLGVAVSWISLWMDRGSPLARVLILLASGFLLSMVTSDLESLVPRTSYIRAVDIWMVACYLFLLITFVEFLLVADRRSLMGKQPAFTEVSNQDASSSSKPEEQSKDVLDSFKASSYRQLLAQLTADPDRVDALSRLAFPFLFFLFTIIYFIIYTQK